jgi:hypothetical protein
LVNQRIYFLIYFVRSRILARHQWLMPVIITTWEAEIRKIAVESQLRQIGS